MRAQLLAGIATLILTASPLPLLAQECATEVTIGNFLYEFEGANYDGSNTTFSYCVTGLDNPGFHGLSNWEMNLDVACINREDLVGCGPEPRFYQEDDPHTGITGIKFDDLEVEKGETECFFFTLAGDWTKRIDDVTVGLKAADDVSYGQICGPTCQNCELSVAIEPKQVVDAVPVLHVYLAHNKPIDAHTPLKVSVRDSAGNIIHRWESKTMTFTQGTPFRMDSPIPGMALPPPGVYEVRVAVKGMVGWVGKVTTFEVLAP
jgi:hypothetical protein